MKRLLLVPLFFLLPGNALAQTRYSEAFDEEVSAKVEVRATADTVVRFVDYSDFSVGGESFSIEEAPRPIDGGAATRGVLFQANLSAGAAQTVNLLATEVAGGELLSLSGPYRLQFDAFIGLADPIPENGSTEQILWSLGADGQITQGRPERANPENAGVWGWLAGEGGYSTEDSVIYQGDALLDKKDNLNHAEYWAMAFDDQRPVATIPANAWTEVLIEAFSDRTRVLYNGHLFHEVETPVGATDGTVMVGYEDPFGSLTDAPDFQWGLIDNVVVEAIVEPPLEPTVATGFAPVSEGGTSSLNEMTLANRRDAPITITAAAFSGADAAEFALLTPLPLTLAAREEATIELRFLPGELGGERTASLDLSIDDAEVTVVSIPLTATKLGLLAHYPLDETEGTVMSDVSGNGFDGAYLSANGGQITLGQPGLASGGSVRLDPRGESGVAVAELPTRLSSVRLDTFSVSMWFELDAADIATGSVLFARGTDLPESSALVVEAQEAPQTVQWLVDTDVGAITSEGHVAIGTPYHLVFTYVDSDPEDPGADRVRIYFNGELAEEIAPITNSSAFDTEAVFQFGGFRGTSGLLGLIDDLQVYSSELSAEDAAFLFANPGMNLVTNGEEPPLPDETVDTDRDGVSDFQEALAMTDPSDPTSVLRVLSADPEAGVTWSSVPGVTYRLERSIDLFEWTLLAEDLPASAAGDTSTFIDGEAGAGGFYRVAPNP